MIYKFSLVTLTALLISTAVFAAPALQAIKQPDACGLSVMEGTKTLAFVDAAETQDLEKPNPVKIDLGKGLIVLQPKPANKGYSEKPSVETINVYESGDTHLELDLKSTGQCGDASGENCESISYIGTLTIKNAQGTAQSKVTADSGCGE